MANAPSPLKPAVVIRSAAVVDMLLGVTIALFAESIVPLGDLIPGFKLWWLVGGLVVIGGAGAFMVSKALERRGPVKELRDDDPVRR